MGFKLFPAYMCVRVACASFFSFLKNFNKAIGNIGNKVPKFLTGRGPWGVTKPVADALFTDIQMPDISGLELVHSMEKPPLIVFTTAYPEYALDGFRVSAVDYLLKPFSFDEFEVAVAKVRSRLPDNSHDLTLSFRADYKTVLVKSSDIR